VVTVQRPWRLFVALPVPSHVRLLVVAAAAPAREAAPELTWTRPEGWHLTLAFLGDVEVPRVAEVEPVVAASRADAGPIGCRLAGADRFGRRALWLGVDDDPAGAIAALGDRIQVALAAARLPVQRQLVRPHLTIARGTKRGAAVTEEAVDAVAPVTAGWEADEVALVRSHLGGGPARYEAIATWPLLGPT
jgi:RNA 2',3'-cyclic 3'-phosphodiesterase